MLLDLPSKPEARRFVARVTIAFVPSVVLGLLLNDLMKRYLFSPWVVAIALLVGGVVILVIERMAHRPRFHDTAEVPPTTALGIGLCQTISMIPGVSRAGATIMGGLLLGLDRKAAAEFSFFLAIPTMVGASALDLYKGWGQIDGSLGLEIAVASLAAFVTAIVVVRAFVAFLARHDLHAVRLVPDRRRPRDARPARGRHRLSVLSALGLAACAVRRPLSGRVGSVGLASSVAAALARSCLRRRRGLDRSDRRRLGQGRGWAWVRAPVRQAWQLAAGATALRVSCSSEAMRFFISSMTALVCVLAESKASFAFCCSAASSGAATPSTSRFLVAHSLSTAMASLCTFEHVIAEVVDLRHHLLERRAHPVQLLGRCRRRRGLGGAALHHAPQVAHRFLHHRHLALGVGAHAVGDDVAGIGERCEVAALRFQQRLGIEHAVLVGLVGGHGDLPMRACLRIVTHGNPTA